MNNIQTIKNKAIQTQSLKNNMNNTSISATTAYKNKNSIKIAYFQNISNAPAFKSKTTIKFVKADLSTRLEKINENYVGPFFYKVLEKIEENSEKLNPINKALEKYVKTPLNKALEKIEEKSVNVGRINKALEKNVKTDLINEAIKKIGVGNSHPLRNAEFLINKKQKGYVFEFTTSVEDLNSKDFLGLNTEGIKALEIKINTDPCLLGLRQKVSSGTVNSIDPDTYKRTAVENKIAPESYANVLTNLLNEVIKNTK